MVISSPRPERPSSVRAQQQAFWSWLDALLERGTVKSCLRKVGRGVILVLEVDNHEELHTLLNQWSEHVPAAFEIHALLPEGTARP